MELSSPKPKKIPVFFPKNFFLCFGMDLSSLEPEKQTKATSKNFLYFCKKKFFPHFRMTADQAVK